MELEFRLSVPLFVRVITVAVPVGSMISDAPEAIVKLLHSAVVVPEITGIIKGDEGILTSFDEVGTPPHQFEAVFQSVLVTPSQVTVGIIVIVTSFDTVALPQVGVEVHTTYRVPGPIAAFGDRYLSQRLFQRLVDAPGCQHHALYLFVCPETDRGPPKHAVKRKELFYFGDIGLFPSGKRGNSARP